jgi:hypothetical protein
MRGRAERKKIEHHELGVVVPARRDEFAIANAHGEGLAAVEHPGPVDALIEFGVAVGKAGVGVVEVVEEAVVVVQDFEVVAQGAADLIGNSGARLVAAMFGDAKGRETKARGGDAGHDARVVFGGEIGGGVDAAARSRTWPDLASACSTK